MSRATLNEAAFEYYKTALATGGIANAEVDEHGNLFVGPDSLDLTPASVTSATTIFTQDLTGYESISVQVTSPGTSCTITYEASNDNVTWFPTAGLSSLSTGSTGYTTTSTAAIVLVFGRRAKFFRARVSTYGSGTVTVVANLSKAAGFGQGTNSVTSGQAAHDAVIASSPFRVGARAVTSNYTAVATGDTADTISTVVGVQIEKPYSIPEADWSYAAAASGIVNTTTAVTIQSAPAAGIRAYITGVQIMAEALGTATEVAIRDGAGGTVLWRTKIGTGGLTNGLDIKFASPLKGTAATLLEVVTLTASGTGAVYFNAQGYLAP